MEERTEGMAGKFICLEGPDGCGKSTIMRKIKAYFREENIAHIQVREPGGTDIGEEIRSIILDNKNTEMAAETESLLYAASRSQLINEKVKPSLKEGINVLSERFVLSSLAYQGIGRGLGLEEVKSINDFGTGGLMPDLTLFFYVDPELTLRRKTSKGGDRLEEEGSDFHKKVYDGYMELIDLYPDNIRVIDASKSIEEVFRESIDHIEELLNKEEE